VFVWIAATYDVPIVVLLKTEFYLCVTLCR